MLAATLQHLVRAIVDNPEDVAVELRSIGKSDLLAKVERLPQPSELLSML
jgi:predicted RNA-binding protein YlqC (UPF0109 family)